MKMQCVEIIETMLTPGIMISACGLLLLAMNNKYSVVVARIRALGEEVRKYKKISSESDLSKLDFIRNENISVQVVKFYYRIKLIRNAVIFYSLAVVFFVLSSFLIGYQLIVQNEIVFVVLSCFLTGMLFVLIGAYFSVREMIKAYEIVQIEVENMQ